MGMLAYQVLVASIRMLGTSVFRFDCVMAFWVVDLGRYCSRVSYVRTALLVD